MSAACSSVPTTPSAQSAPGFPGNAAAHQSTAAADAAAPNSTVKNSERHMRLHLRGQHEVRDAERPVGVRVPKSGATAQSRRKTPASSDVMPAGQLLTGRSTPQRPRSKKQSRPAASADRSVARCRGSSACRCPSRSPFRNQKKKSIWMQRSTVPNRTPAPAIQNAHFVFISAVLHFWGIARSRFKTNPL